MSSIQYLFQQAQLAEAAYADLTSAIGDQTILQQALDAANEDQFGGSFSAAQASTFVADWEVIDHVPNTLAGFSATIFRNRQTLEYTLAVRGTELSSLADLRNDVKAGERGQACITV